jgi:hypothetical protein
MPFFFTVCIVVYLTVTVFDFLKNYTLVFSHMILRKFNKSSKKSINIFEYCTSNENHRR